MSSRAGTGASRIHDGSLGVREINLGICGNHKKGPKMLEMTIQFISNNKMAAMKDYE